jgi:hypothetical protein
MGDFFGKKAKKNQTNTMNQMMKMAQSQVDDFKLQQKDAKKVADASRDDYNAFEFSNPFEDMTVDMRAADFQVQQGAQQRADIMGALQGSAGSSGIAGLAQSLANQGQLQTQRIAANISQQERQNQIMSAKGEASVQAAEASVQAAEASKQATLLGMDYGSLAGANQGYQGALANQMSGMGMKVDMYGAQAQNSMFNKLIEAGGQAASAYFGAGGGR